jgi:hypothetical protein
MSADPRRERDLERRVGRRTGRRIAVGAIIGTVVGAVAGLIVGAIVFEPWSAGHWAMTLALAILVGGIAMVQGGLAGLDAADPGSEPTHGGDPLRDERWTSPEQDDGSA